MTLSDNEKKVLQAIQTFEREKSPFLPAVIDLVGPEFKVRFGLPDEQVVETTVRSLCSKRKLVKTDRNVIIEYSSIPLERI